MCVVGMGRDLHEETRHERHFQWLAKNSCSAWCEKKKVLLECREGFRGGRQRATSTTEVHWGAWGYGAGGFKNWREGVACETSRNKKRGGHQRRETQTLRGVLYSPSYQETPKMNEGDMGELCFFFLGGGGA
jgi:hypothetical protein